MRSVAVRNISRDVTLADAAPVADNMWTRLRGLIGRPPLREGQGLVIRPSRGIHSFFMSYPIDAIYVNDQGEVVRRLENLRPFRAAPMCFRTRYVVELPAGTLNRTRTEVGDRIELS